MGRERVRNGDVNSRGWPRENKKEKRWRKEEEDNGRGCERARKEEEKRRKADKIRRCEGRRSTGRRSKNGRKIKEGRKTLQGEEKRGRRRGREEAALCCLGVLALAFRAGHFCLQEKREGKKKGQKV